MHLSQATLYCLWYKVQLVINHKNLSKMSTDHSMLNVCVWFPGVYVQKDINSDDITGEELISSLSRRRVLMTNFSLFVFHVRQSKVCVCVLVHIFTRQHLKSTVRTLPLSAIYVSSDALGQLLDYHQSIWLLISQQVKKSWPWTSAALGLGG